MIKKENTDFRLFRRILLQAKPYRFQIGLYFGLSILSTPLALLAPVPMKLVVDNVIGGDVIPQWLDYFVPDAVEQSPSSLLFFSIVFFFLIKLLSIIQKLYTGNILYSRITENILLDFRSKLLNYAQRLSIGFHDSKGIGHSSYRIQYDTYAVQRVVFDTIVPVISAVLTFGSMLYIMLLLDQTLALIAISVAPFIFLMTELFRKPLRRGWSDYKNRDYLALNMINEVLSMLRVIKAFGREKYEGNRYTESTQRAIDSRLKVAWVSSGLDLLMGLTTAIGTIVVLYIGTSHVMEGTLSLGNLLLIMSYLAQLYSPLTTIGTMVAGLQSQLTSAERAFSLLDHPIEVPEASTAVPLKKAKGAINFEDVSFSYNKKDLVLRNISFEIAAGTRIGIAGRTGAGKSTLVSLLFRFYDPDSGKICLDGRDLKDYRLKDLRRQFSIVLQDSLLFSGSIAENIAYGRPGKIDMDQIVHAAKVANADDFIRNLPDGYQSKVGEKGMQLSGGERQRIALARAFVADAPILVLDEPTSALDTDTEVSIVRSMNRIMEGRTTFIIAHRLSTLQSCDLLLVIENGQVAKITSNVVETVKEAILSGGLHVNAKGEILD